MTTASMVVKNVFVETRLGSLLMFEIFFPLTILTASMKNPQLHYH